MAQDIIRLSKETKNNLDEYRIILANQAALSGLTQVSVDLHDASYSELVSMCVHDALIDARRLKSLRRK